MNINKISIEVHLGPMQQRYIVILDKETNKVLVSGDTEGNRGSPTIQYNELTFSADSQNNIWCYWPSLVTFVEKDSKSKVEIEFEEIKETLPENNKENIDTNETK